MTRQALPPEADKPRVVCRYKGAQIRDAREHVQIVFSVEPPRGVKGCLRIEGFQPTGPDGAWQRRHTPIAVIKAQAICNTFFQPEEQETP
jgi:hypothetical protein